MVEAGVKEAGKAIKNVSNDLLTGAKKVVGHATDAAQSALSATTDAATDATTGVTSSIKKLFAGSGDDIMQLVCVILLGVILVMITPANSAVVLMRRWWVRMIAVIFLILVLFMEGEKPRVAILLGLVILALVLFSDMPFLQSESFYGRVPTSTVEQADTTVPVGPDDKVMDQEEPVPVDAGGMYASI